MNAPDDSSLIRITPEELSSRHVDDLIQRQMSLRGDPGVTRQGGRRWYLQNWFVLGLAGLVGAIVAWGVIEPWFDDNAYIQGEVSGLDFDFRKETDVASPKGDKGTIVTPEIIGRMEINGEPVVILSGTRTLTADGKVGRLEGDSLRNGRIAGVHVSAHSMGHEDYGVAAYVVPDPPPLSTPTSSLRDQNRIHSIFGLLLFSITGGIIGLFIGAVDGLVCRVLRRAFACGFIGLLVGVVGGLLSGVLGGMVYTPLNALAAKHGGEGAALSGMGFGIQMIGRTFAWGLAGITMGLGQGLALRSKRLTFYGLIGGVVGGLLGGLAFDPVDLIMDGADNPSAWVSRLVGISLIGLCVGGMIGVVELLARDAWLRMTHGPLKGKEFVIFKDVMRVGSSPRADLYLFNDSAVAEQHAIIRAIGDECELETIRPATHPVLVNGRAVTRARLKHGDDVTIGTTAFAFQKRKS